MNPRYTEALYCPLCDLRSSECIQPEREVISADGGYIEGHSGHWITLAERKQDEALENLRTNRSVLDALEQSESQPYLETAQPPAPMAAGGRDDEQDAGYP